MTSNAQQSRRGSSPLFSSWNSSALNWRASLFLLLSLHHLGTSRISREQRAAVTARLSFLLLETSRISDGTFRRRGTRRQLLRPCSSFLRAALASLPGSAHGGRRSASPLGGPGGLSGGKEHELRRFPSLHRLSSSFSLFARGRAPPSSFSPSRWRGITPQPLFVAAHAVAASLLLPGFSSRPSNAQQLWRGFFFSRI